MNQSTIQPTSKWRFKAKKPLNFDLSMKQAVLLGVGAGVVVAGLQVLAMMGISCFA